jgi:hypothetical protein
VSTSVVLVFERIPENREVYYLAALDDAVAESLAKSDGHFDALWLDQWLDDHGYKPVFHTMKAQDKIRVVHTGYMANQLDTGPAEESDWG